MASSARVQKEILGYKSDINIASSGTPGVELQVIQHLSTVWMYRGIPANITSCSYAQHKQLLSEEPSNRSFRWRFQLTQQQGFAA